MVDYRQATLCHYNKALLLCQHSQAGFDLYFGILSQAIAPRLFPVGFCSQDIAFSPKFIAVRFFPLAFFA